MQCRKNMTLITKDDCYWCEFPRKENILISEARQNNLLVHMGLNLRYEGQSKNNEPKSLLAIFVAIKSKVIHQKKAQG